MKLWIDDERKPPTDDLTEWWPVRSVVAAIHDIKIREGMGNPFELIDIDHDAGYYANFGGDYIEVLKFLESTGRNYPIRIHSMNIVGVQNMRAIIEKNGWTEIM